MGKKTLYQILHEEKRKFSADETLVFCSSMINELITYEFVMLQEYTNFMFYLALLKKFPKIKTYLIKPS